MRITSKEYFENCPAVDLTEEQVHNVIKLLYVVNQLRDAWGKPLTVNSGYRNPEHNKKIGGAPRSNHLLCSAIDLGDKDGSLKAWLTANDNEMLEKFDLYMEHPDDTKTWAHVQINPPKSGKRVFGK